MTAELPAWLRWPEKCQAGVVRAGYDEPCDKPSVAVALYTGDEFEPHAYPVCKHHARGRPMLSLLGIIALARELQ